MRFLTERSSNGVLDPSSICTKTSTPVLEVLRENCPPTEQRTTDALTDYGETPTSHNLDVLEETAAGVASRISGAPGLGGVHSLALKRWLLGFGRVSTDLQISIAKLVA